MGGANNVPLQIKIDRWEDAQSWGMHLPANNTLDKWVLFQAHRESVEGRAQSPQALYKSKVPIRKWFYPRPYPRGLETFRGHPVKSMTFGEDDLSCDRVVEMLGAVREANFEMSGEWSAYIPFNRAELVEATKNQSPEWYSLILAVKQILSNRNLSKVLANFFELECNLVVDLRKYQKAFRKFTFRNIDLCYGSQDISLPFLLVAGVTPPPAYTPNCLPGDLRDAIQNGRERTLEGCAVQDLANLQRGMIQETLEQFDSILPNLRSNHSNPGYLKYKDEKFRRHGGCPCQTCKDATPGDPRLDTLFMQIDHHGEEARDVKREFGGMTPCDCSYEVLMAQEQRLGRKLRLVCTEFHIRVCGSITTRDCLFCDCSSQSPFTPSHGRG